MFPDFDFLGPYNVSRHDLSAYDGPIAVTEVDVPPLTRVEFDVVYDQVKRILSRYGKLAGDSTDDFYLYDDKFFDRTQKLEVYLCTFADAVAPLIMDLQALLQRYPLWRVLFVAPDPRDAIVVYPTEVRVAPERYSQSTDGLRKVAARIAAMTE
jgi:hypothetical protein